MTVKKYKVVYWNNGNRLVKNIEAPNIVAARYNFYMSTACDDIISVTEITDNVV